MVSKDDGNPGYLVQRSVNFALLASHLASILKRFNISQSERQQGKINRTLYLVYTQHSAMEE